MKRTALFWTATQLFLLPVNPQVTISAIQLHAVSIQRLSCNTGYTLEKCLKDIAILRRTLAKYHLAQLGEWNWILVRSEDWKSIVVPRALDPDSPTFTYYAKRETFVEEALLTDVPGRTDELKRRWHMGVDKLRDLAIAHELGHAFCNDGREEVANRQLELLRNRKPPACEPNLDTKMRGEERKSHIDTRKEQIPFGNRVSHKLIDTTPD